MNDVTSSNLSLSLLNAAKDGETKAAEFLKMARKANLDHATSPNDFTAGRRAVLARKAYDAKVNAGVARTRAAFALLAKDEGDKALAARAGMARATTVPAHGVFVEQVKRAEFRRSIMLQASEAAATAFDAAPGLPASIGGPSGSASAGQITVGHNDQYRPPSYVERAGGFFPSDIRAAASSLRGLPGMNTNSPHDAPLGWIAGLEAACDEAAVRVESAGLQKAAAITSQEASTADLQVQAEGIIQQLSARHTAEMVNGVPYLHIAGGLIIGALLYKFLR